MGSGLVPKEGIMMGRIQQGLGRDTADVETGTSQGGFAILIQPCVRTGSPEAELGTTYGRNITSGTGADYHNIEIVLVFHRVTHGP